LGISRRKTVPLPLLDSFQKGLAELGNILTTFSYRSALPCTTI
jgi:hypothetical protein